MEDLDLMPTAAFWRGRRVLLTGHTGFKGAWLAQWLIMLGAKVTGIALPPDTSPNLFAAARLQELLTSHLCDLRDAATLRALVAATEPEIVFHLAAQALVRRSYREPVNTFDTNVMGTVHLLEALRYTPSVQAAVVVTSDKVYRNDAARHAPFKETDPLGGHDPYSASKAACEIVVASYRDSFLREQGVAVATARAGNVIGGGDWAEDRLLPDAVKAWLAGDALKIRKPEALRPWQHVLEPARGYLLLAEQIAARPDLVGAYNFGPVAEQAASVRTVVDLAVAAYQKGAVVYAEDVSDPHEAQWLALDPTRARLELGLEARWPLKQAIDRTIGWYRAYAEGRCARGLCESDLLAYGAVR
jgi:CDP-glucose 4,6-dehydratase